MRTTTIAALLFLSSAQAFSPAGVSTRSFGVARAQSAGTVMFSSALDGLNREMLNDDDDDAPMTKAEMKAAEKEMKAEMKRLKEEAAAAAKEE
jgi:hypothetical protein